MSMSQTARTNALIAAVTALVAGGGGAASTYALRLPATPPAETVQTTVQTELDQRLQMYVTRDELTRIRDAERDRLEGKLDRISEEVRRLALAVERLRR